VQGGDFVVLDRAIALYKCHLVADGDFAVENAPNAYLAHIVAVVHQCDQHLQRFFCVALGVRAMANDGVKEWV